MPNKKNKFKFYFFFFFALLLSSPLNLYAKKKKTEVEKPSPTPTPIYEGGHWTKFQGISIYIKGMPKKEHEIPGMKELKSTLVQEKLMVQQVSRFFFNLTNREYYDLENIHGERDVQNIKDKLVDAFKINLGMNSNNPLDLKLSLITNLSLTTTIIFPEFYHLSRHEQMAVLFQNVYTKWNNGYDYEETSLIKFPAQKYFENIKNYENGIDLIYSLGFYRDLMYYAIQKDLEKGILNKDGFLIKESNQIKLTIDTLLGVGFSKCINNQITLKIIENGHAQDSEFSKTCLEEFQPRLYELSILFPSSMFIYALTLASSSKEMVHSPLLKKCSPKPDRKTCDDNDPILPSDTIDFTDASLDNLIYENFMKIEDNKNEKYIELRFK